MARLLIRAGKDPLTVVAPETTLTQDVFNSNSGNFLFQHSVWKSLATDGSELVANSTLSERRTATDRDAAITNEQFDHFVVPMANAFRSDFITSLDRLSDFIEKLTIPTTVVGIGAQAPADYSFESLQTIDDQVRRFVGLVLDRSASIGVRGEFTKDYLMSLGFRDDEVDIIGCPSLFLHGPHHVVERRVADITADSPVALNLTPEVPGIGRFTLDQLTRQRDLTYVSQDQHDLRLLLWGVPHPHVTDPDVPVHLQHQLYQAGRITLFVDSWSWYDFLATRDFTYGTRFHGNVASLLAGTPAMLLAHDSRTRELAEYHHMPHLVTPRLDESFDAAQLHAQTDLTDFNNNLPQLFGRYTEFLHRNQLTHRWEPGQSGQEFDAALAQATFPPGVAPLLSNGGGELAQRLEWLRHAAVIDLTRHPQRYNYPFNHPEYHGGGTRNARLLAKHEATMAKQAKLIEALTERIEILELGAWSTFLLWSRRKWSGLKRRLHLG